MTIKIPDRYPFAEKVPKGGSSCANCFFLSKDEKHCRNKIYQAEEGTRTLLVLPANQFCCMVWSPHARS